MKILGPARKILKDWKKFLKLLNSFLTSKKFLKLQRKIFKILKQILKLTNNFKILTNKFFNDLEDSQTRKKFQELLNDPSRSEKILKRSEKVLKIRKNYKIFLVAVKDQIKFFKLPKRILKALKNLLQLGLCHAFLKVIGLN